MQVRRDCFLERNMKRLIPIIMMLCFVMTANAQTRLHPMTQSQQKIWGERYFGRWLSQEATQQMLQFPSFGYPSALYVFCYHGENGRLQAKWCVVNKDARPNESKLKLDSIDIWTDKTTALKFCKLIEHAVNTSMFVGERLGFDGTRYFFGECLHVATTWSPVGNCKRLTDVLEKAITAVRNQNEEELKGLLPEVDALTTVFEKLYPND